MSEPGADIPEPGIVAVAWAMIRQVQAVAERQEKAADRQEAANEDARHLLRQMLIMQGELRVAAVGRRRAAGIPDHEFAEDAVG